MKQTLLVRTVVINGVLTLCTLGLLSVLVYFSIQKRFQDLRRSAVAVVGADIRTAIERGLMNGIRCNELRTVPAILSRQASTTSTVRGIGIYDARGVLLHATTPGFPELLPPAYRNPVKPDPVSVPLSSTMACLYVPLFNSFSVREGTVALDYVTSDASRFQALRWSLFYLVLGISLLCSVVSILPARLALRTMKDTFDDMTAAIDGRPVDEATALVNEVVNFRESIRGLTHELRHASTTPGVAGADDES